MTQLNSLIIEGNVVRTGELSEPVSGFKVCKFPVAVNRWYKNKNGEGVNEVSYFDVETYGKMAEVCSKQANKGRGVRVVGRLKQDRWKDANEKQQSRVYVVAEHVEYKPKSQDGVSESEKENSEVVPEIKNEETKTAVPVISMEQQSEKVEEVMF